MPLTRASTPDHLKDMLAFFPVRESGEMLSLFVEHASEEFASLEPRQLLSANDISFQRVRHKKAKCVPQLHAI